MAATRDQFIYEEIINGEKYWDIANSPWHSSSNGVLTGSGIRFDDLRYGAAMVWFTPGRTIGDAIYYQSMNPDTASATAIVDHVSNKNSAGLSWQMANPIHTESVIVFISGDPIAAGSEGEGVIDEVGAGMMIIASNGSSRYTPVSITPTTGGGRIVTFSLSTAQDTAPAISSSQYMGGLIVPTGTDIYSQFRIDKVLVRLTDSVENEAGPYFPEMAERTTGSTSELILLEGQVTTEVELADIDQSSPDTLAYGVALEFTSDEGVDVVHAGFRIELGGIDGRDSTSTQILPFDVGVSQTMAITPEEILVAPRLFNSSGDPTSFWTIDEFMRGINNQIPDEARSIWYITASEYLPVIGGPQ
jgi:hypothetical protein